MLTTHIKVSLHTLNPNSTLSLWDLEFGFSPSRGASVPPPSDQSAHHGGRQHAPLGGSGGPAGDGGSLSRLPPVGGSCPWRCSTLGRQARAVPPTSILHPHLILLVLWDLPKEAQGKSGRWDQKNRQQHSTNENEARNRGHESKGPSYRSTKLLYMRDFLWFFAFAYSSLVFAIFRNDCDWEVGWGLYPWTYLSLLRTTLSHTGIISK